MNSANSSTVPLCVDLDGTLVHSDMLIESGLMLIRQQPATVFRLPGWLMGGKANLKHQIASRVDFSNATIPYNQDVVEFVRKERASRQTVDSTTLAMMKTTFWYGQVPERRWLFPLRMALPSLVLSVFLIFLMPTIFSSEIT